MSRGMPPPHSLVVALKLTDEDQDDQYASDIAERGLLISLVA